jgi:MFS family permease
MITIFRGAKGRVFILICLMFFISYVDRVNISIAAPIMRKELHLTNTQLGFVLSAFGLCYATFQMINGFLGDYLGPRRMLSALGLVWSAGTLLTAASTGLASLVIGRAVVGLGEGGTIPTAARARSNWVSPGDRGFAAGFAHTCARLAAICTPTIVLGLIPVFGWRGAFAVLGAVGLAWTTVWWV